MHAGKTRCLVRRRDKQTLSSNFGSARETTSIRLLCGRSVSSNGSATSVPTIATPSIHVFLNRMSKGRPDSSRSSIRQVSILDSRHTQLFNLHGAFTPCLKNECSVCRRHVRAAPDADGQGQQQERSERDEVADRGTSPKTDLAMGSLRAHPRDRPGGLWMLPLAAAGVPGEARCSPGLTPIGRAFTVLHGPPGAPSRGALHQLR